MNVKLLILIPVTLLTVLEPVDGQPTQPPTNPPKETPTVIDTSQTVEPPPRRQRRTRSSHKDVVMVGAPIVVREGDSVNDVVGIGSSIQIDGTVNGDLVSVLGNVKLGPEARVEKDVVVVCGKFEVDPSAHVERAPVVISPEGFLGLTNWFGAELAVAGREWIESGLLLARPLPLPNQSKWAWAVAGTCLLFYLLIELLFPKTIRTTLTALEEKPGSAFMAGLLTSFLTVPVFLLLIITVVGIVVVPFGACALLAILMLGKTCVYHYTGQALTGRFFQNGLASSLLALVAGAALFYLVYCIPVLGALVWTMAGLMGVGAVMLTAMGRSKPTAMVAVPVVSDAVAGVEGAKPPGVIEMPRAGFWIRVLATLLDLALVVLIIAAALGRPKWFPVAWLLYHLAFWSWKGTTVGGIICNLRIVRLDGHPLSPGIAVIRLLGSVFSLAVAGLGFFWAGWSADKQSWHDKIAGTTIVRLPRSTPLT